ncbi:uncharacterized protein LOC119385594 [Rhipicephalus sanguineus]|uniref:uncharacterized protein LOC119385594 n=1 Tax=Rhipicephalus sanguineus TaxID=34632 RepID=UPI001893B38D|nr:uncharacterized protein LOC119385594 [Rhipicephalus sanguineus]
MRVQLTEPAAPWKLPTRRPSAKTSPITLDHEHRVCESPCRNSKCPSSAARTFKYLKTYLAGAAKRAIEGISLTEANYNIAVKVLTERFERKDLLIDDHIDSLLAIEPIETSSEVARLRDLYEQIQFRTGFLESLGMPSSEYAVVLHRVLMCSLPEDLAIQYRRLTKTGADAADSAVQSRDELVKAILKFLQVEVESREESRASRERATSGRPSTNRRAADTSPPPHLLSALALTARSSSPGAASRPAQTICPLCGISDHLTRDCRAALSAEEKHQRLSSNSCCFRTPFSALCDIWGRRGSDSPQPTGAENREAATQREKHVTTAPASSTRSSSVLLQTATVWASGTRGCVPVRLLLDTGSQRTFIRKDLSQQLCLPSTGYEEMAVYTFGGSKHPRHYQCRRVNVTLCGRIGPIVVDLEALEVPEVCTVKGPALEPNVINMMHHRNLTFADEVQGDQPQDSTISVLIGSDHYWKVVTGRVERFTDNLYAVETIFGWVIQGMCANVYHPSTPRNISATALFLACSDDWRSEVRRGDPSEMWRLDAIGINDGQEDDVSKHPALIHFRSAVHKNAGCYVIPLMIKTQGLTSCSNRSVAETRLKRQLQRFQHHSEVLKEYHATISEYFKEGHAERLVPSAPLGPTVHCLPHHAAVRREAMPTKVRAVFNASSHKYGEPSLDDMLDKGIDWEEPLPPDVEDLWKKTASEHPQLSGLRIRRCLSLTSQDQGI